VDKTVNASTTFRCNGSAPNASFSITQDFGLYKTGPGWNRMRNTTATTQYLPYTVTLTPSSGTVPKNTIQTLTLSGTVLGSDYGDAFVGNYSDTVVITLSP
jgi:spore coat protein U-like protein